MNRKVILACRCIAITINNDDDDDNDDGNDDKNWVLSGLVRSLLCS